MLNHEIFESKSDLTECNYHNRDKAQGMRIGSGLGMTTLPDSTSGVFYEPDLNGLAECKSKISVANKIKLYEPAIKTINTITLKIILAPFTQT